MKNVYGNALTLTLFGESHGAAVGAVLDGLAPGIPVDEAVIARELTRRRPADATATARREPDNFVIESGIFGGFTTGTPLCILIPNTEQHSADYSGMVGRARPAHCDYPAHCKYRGFEDYRGGGHFSGRLTAALVAAGAVVGEALRRKNISIGTHLLRCAGVGDRAFDFSHIGDELAALRAATHPTLSDEAWEHMREAILRAGAEGDSVGGVAETVVTGLEAGLGEPWFDTVEGMLSHGLFSVPAVKGVEFGDGFALADMRGSEANDPYRVENGKITTRTNRMGGIGGGITNGMPLIFRCAIKPTPSISREQETVDFVRGENVSLRVRGRHDPCIAPRACPVIDAVTALTVADIMVMHVGTDALA